MTEIAVFGGGCFWCTEAIFNRLKGVVKVVPGYAGGTSLNPNHFRVSEGLADQAEVVQIEFDPHIISYPKLLEVFWQLHDPTTPNQQGADVGPQYRSVILYTSPIQEAQAKSKLEELQKSGKYTRPVVTDIQPLDTFYTAEEYHHQYYEKNQAEPYCELVISPKIEKLVQYYNNLLK